jgi:alpha-tubulin suppressor-like RCC1 family protein
LIGIRSVAAGAQGHTCALTNNGLVTCWGRGLGTLGAGSALPQAKAGIAGARAVSAGDHHACALVNEQAWCWGGNFNGALGDGTRVDRQAPAAVVGLPPLKQVACGNSYTCAVDTAKGLWCWGRSESGQLGVSTPPDVVVPQRLPGVAADQVMVSKGLHTCVRASSGEVSCFGSNAVGQLGIGASSLSPELVPLTTGIVDAVSGSGGTFHSCVRRANGKVACWGINSAGQLGDGNSGTLSMNPVQVVGLP